MVRRPISVLLGGMFTLAVGAFVAFGPRAFEGYLPEPAIAFLEARGLTGLTGLTGQGGGGPVSGTGESPADYLEDAADGLHARGPIAAGPGNQPVFIADVISGYTTRVASDIPAEITTIRPILGCLLTPPADGSIVGHVANGRSGVRTALATYNDTQLAAEVQAFVDAYRKTGTSDPTARTAPAYEAYDVAVTETRAPVYLVLETGEGNRLWNLHLAPGARIEREVLLGGDQAGVANLDPVVPVEVLLRDGLAECGISPAYPLNDGHQLVQAPSGSTASPEGAGSSLSAHLEAVARYDTWFQDSFGVRSSDSRVGFDTGTISLIGPVPGEVPGEAGATAVYAPISGSKIRMTQDSYFEIAGQVAAGEDFAARVKAIATSFAFGDLRNLAQGVDF